MTNLTNFNLSSGSNVLETAFSTPKLFDASSFYNWEQDNIPLAKLFQRTDLLHQAIGYLGDENRPTIMTLSSTANHALGVYDNLDDIVRRIPQRLTFPLLVEICDYNNLGDLELDGITTIGDGSLQFKNQLHQYDPYASATTVASHPISPVGSVNTPTTITTVTARDGFELASSVRLGVNIFDNSQLDASAGRLFVTKKPNTEEESDRLHFYTHFTCPGGVGANETLVGTPYTSSIDNTIQTYDLNARELNGSGVSLESARIAVANTNPENNVSVNAYGNYFTSIRIRNCHGQIKFTGLCQDGASGSDATGTKLVHNARSGFYISNSNILLEHCAAMRNREHGYNIINSEIGVLGSFIAYRNYPRNVDFTRTTGLIGHGLKAINSNITFIDEPLGVTADANFNRFTVAFSRNNNGISLHSSQINGGTRSSSGKSNAGGTDTKTGILQSYQNTLNGIFADLSEISYLGRLDIFNNKIGINAENSNINTPQLTVDHNQAEGILLNKSNLVYGYRLDEVLGATVPDGDNATATKNKVAYHVSHNGINLRLKKSKVEPYYTEVSSIPSYIGKWGGNTSGSTYDSLMTNHGSNTGTMYDLPQIVVEEHSDLELLNAGFVSNANAPVRGKCVYVKNGSKAALRGTSRSRTVASLDKAGSNFTMAEIVDAWQSAAFCADYNSYIEFTGPTKISRYGIAALAENNSTIAFKTPTLTHNTIPQKTRLGLTTGDNQTKIELHSTRACVVANKNSSVIGYQIGGTVSGAVTTVIPRFNTGGISDTELSSIWNNTNQESYIQFYPNPFTSSILGDGYYETNGATPFTRSNRLIASGSSQNICAGGMAIRAVNNSIVDFNLVNFLFPYTASSVSGVIYSYTGSGGEKYTSEPGANVTNLASVGYYNYGAVNGGVDPFTNQPLFDAGGSPGLITNSDPALAQRSWNTSGYANQPNPCNGWYNSSSIGTKIHIWNICDTSRIHMANARINFGDPKGICDLSSYHGPVGKWANGVALDYFGIWGAATTYNNDNAYRNQGIFRLMLGHRADLKAMFGLSSNHQTHGIVTIGRDTGGYPIDQINSQGYMMFTMEASALTSSDARRIIGHLDGGANVSGISLSAGEDIWGWGLPAPGSGTPAIIAPNMDAYMSRNHLTSGMSDISGVPSFSMPPLHLDWQGYMRNFLDETASNIFANAKQLSLKKVNGVSIYRSHNYLGGEGRDGESDVQTFGVGVKSLNIFDLNELV
jgi:hypothetical protein